MKIDWSKAAKHAVEEEGSAWDDWKWQSAKRRIRAFKFLQEVIAGERDPESGNLLFERDPVMHSLKRMNDREYYRKVLNPTFGPTKAVVVIPKKPQGDESRG